MASEDRIQVLLVEDSPSDARLLCEFLQNYRPQQFAIDHVERLEEALRLATDRAFDVILLDLTLPDSAGLDTCTRMRRAVPHVPIVVLTGVDDETIALEAMRQGVEDYLVKGQIQGGTVGRALRYAVERSRSARSLREAHEHLQLQAEELRAANDELLQNEEALRISEQRVRLRLDSILSPQGDLGNLELADIIDAQAIQSLMDDFYALARIPMAIIDLKGRVLVGVGWQEICTRFHRVHPQTCKHCLESDTQLTVGIAPGECRLYKCKNNMWDIATPLMVAGNHVGNLFSGQFFFEDEPMDRELFRAQARGYGFDEQEYLAALEAVPRLSRESVDAGMSFLIKLARMISQLSYANIQLARSLGERDRLMESLRLGRERLDRAQEVAHLGSWELDLVRNELTWSDEVYRIFGLQPQEFGATYEAFLEHVHPDDRAAVDAAYAGSLRENRDTYEIDHRVVRQDTGEVRIVHEKCEHFRDAAGQIVRSVGMVHDITERERAQEELLQLNRTLKALSKSSQALTHATEESAYLQEVCKIIVEDCGHAMVWIGYAEQDEAKSVRPVAYAGFEEGYLETLQITWADTERGRGPTGTAIRTGQPSICRNMLTDPQFAPWREQALKRGYASSIVLPLLSDGKAFGAVTIYAGEPDSFSQDEAQLLRELAADLAHGVTALRLRAAHAQAEQSLRESEARLRLAQDAAHAGTWEWDLRTNRNYWSGELWKLYGLDPQSVEPSYEAWRQTVLPEDRPRVEQITQEAARQGAVLELEWRVHDRTGQERWLMSRGQPVRDAQGRTVSYRGIVLDITDRKRAEEALRDSERRSKLLSEVTARLLAAEDPQAIIEDLCHAVMEYLGCECFFNFLADPAAGRLRLNACAGIPESERAKLEWLDYGVAVCGCAARDATRIVAEHIPTTADPRTALVKSYGVQAYACHPIMAGTEVLGTLSFGTTTREIFQERELSLMKAVTDLVAVAVQRQRGEHALRESEQRLRLALEGGRMGRWEWDVRRDATFWDERVYELLGLEPCVPAASGLFFEAIDGRDRSTVRQLVDQALAEGENFHAEFRVRRLQGETPWLVSRGKVIRDEDGRAVRMMGVIYDVTQRKQMEADLRRLNDQLEAEVQAQTEELKDTIDRLEKEVTRRVQAEGTLRKRSRMLEAFFQHTITPLAFMDKDFNFVRVNAAYARADHKDPEYFVGQNHFALYPHEENQAIFARVVRTKQPYFVQAKPFTYPDAPQRVTYWDWQLTPLLGDSGDVQFLVLNLEDVTARQTAFQELEHRARQLQKLTLELSQAEDRERKRLAELLHDDLQQQLAAAKFHLSLLGNRIPKDPLLQRIVAQLDQILKDSIDKSRSLSHELSPAVLYQTDLGETFEWLARQLKAKHGLTVHVESRGCIDPQSEVLKVLLYKTAREILFNVVKHAGVKEARLRIQRLNGGVWLTIADQGQGFDPCTLGKTGGFGLLSIRERIELLGGRMKIRSAPGRGSTFLIVLPDGQPSEDGKPATAGAGPHAHPMSATPGRRGELPLRVLLADDHKVMREGLATLLNEQSDLKVVGHAGNGREAVDLAYQLGPDVVVMDVAMPLMAGDEATRQIKLHLPNVRVVALSMFEEANMAGAMRAAGAEAYLLKTAPSDELLAAIRGRKV